MDDRFLNELRRDPDPEFAARLRQKLSRHERSRATLKWKPAFAAAVVVVAVAALFAFPSVRASAQSILDMFRVRNFAAVEFDPERLKKLDAQSKDNGLLMFGGPEVLKDPGPDQVVASPAAAGAIAGIDVRVPSELPRGLVLQKVWIGGEGAARFTANATQMRSLLEALDIRDLEVPQSIDGKSITVRKPKVVFQEYRSDKRRATLIQARQPEVSLPPGANLPQLAEIGMRILGVDAAQARRLAQSVDWNTTLLIPVPQDASSFRGVEIHGNPGLLVTSSGEREGKPKKQGSIVMWTEGDRVFAVASDLHEMELLTMAESVK